ncbi:MAG TPA: hypothetical protein VK986_09970, partial [Tepidisphaeraceae bacterium]|nr:hypothetical protein [Tepidisphaeraceae bacterium]
MQSTIRRNIVRGGLAVAGVAWAGSASAAVVGYWRMETDNNAGASAVSVPDSSGFVSANPLTSSSATLIAQAPINP